MFTRFSIHTRTVTLSGLVPLLMAACASTPLDPAPATVVAFGDSTTAPRTVDGTALRVYADRLQEDFKRRGLTGQVINAGVGGNNTDQARARFETDVLAHQPDLVVIQFGLNDSCIDLWDGKDRPRITPEAFADNLRYFVETLRARNCNVILMTANPMRWTEPLRKLYGQPPYEVNDPWGFNRTNQRYGDVVRSLAAELKVPIVDVYEQFHRYDAVPGQSVDDLLLDGMHPNERGHALIADALLKEIASLP